jgi:hypothetical protein
MYTPYGAMSREPLRPNGEIKEILNGTKNRLEHEGELKKTIDYDLIKNISQDALNRIAERLDLNIAFYLLFLEKRTNITFEARKLLVENMKLTLALNNVIRNISDINTIDFKIEIIDVEYDPEYPENKSIEIYLDIKAKDLDERLKLKHMIVQQAFKGIDEESRKNIFFMGAV